MVGVGWFAAIFVGALAGWLAERFMERDHNLLQNIILGIAGAIVFNFVISAVFGSTTAGWIGQTFAGFVGACALIAGAKMWRDRKG